MLRREISRSSTKENNEQSSAKYVTKLEQEFDVGESLGKGGYGEIFKAKRKCDNNAFAIKIIKFKSSNFEDFATIRKEANFLSKLTHNNIVRYFNSWIETAEIPRSEYNQDDCEDSLCSEILKLSLNECLSDNYDDEADNEDDSDEIGEEVIEEKTDSDSCVVFQSDYSDYVEIKYLFIQMELCEKRTLRNSIDCNLYLDENRVMRYFKEICEGLSYIHSNKIVHRDLNPKNIFLTANDVIKIGDFGLSKQIENESDLMQQDKLPYASLSAACGTSVYIAPEIRNGNKYNIKADIYSLGVTYFEMCSKPMTEYEKIDTFPITLRQWKTIHFVTNGPTKKKLLQKLLQEHYGDRPKCDEILEILKSDTSFDEIRNVIQKNRKISPDEWRNFQRTLKSIQFEKEKLLNIFLTTAEKIFELHGGQKLSMPTFMPACSDHYEHSTTLLSRNGNFSSVSKTSGIAFCYYVGTNKINKIRRYSIGKVFEESFHSLKEIQECLFQAISPEVDDYVTDAEMLYIGEKLYNEICSENKQFYFLINDGLIFWNILKHCKIDRKQASLFINSGIDLSCLTPNIHVELFLWTMIQKFPVNTAQSFITQKIRNNDSGIFTNININILNKAFDKLNTIVKNAKEFGVKADIFVSPLLMNHSYSTGFMFQMVHKCGFKTLATGGRFHALIKSCTRSKKKQPLNIAAVDISFNVANVLQLMKPVDTISRNIAVLIVAENKPSAIPLYKKLLTQNIKCEIVKKLIVTESYKKPQILIHFSDENSCIVYRVGKENLLTSSWKLTQIFKGQWRDELLSAILSNELETPILYYPLQIAY